MEAENTTCDVGDISRQFISDLAIDRLKNAETILVTFSKPDELKTEKDKLIMKLTNEQKSLIDKLLIEKAECDELMDKYSTLSRECCELKTEKMQLIHEIGLMKCLFQQLKTTFESNLKLADTMRIIFQKLIHGSGINWIKDEKNLLIELGQELIKDETN